jgi:heterotetrameric sarcosine oxidase delta subunit
MMLITCPWCGPRDETEFHYGGEATRPYPSEPSAVTDAEWADFVFARANPKGPLAERWCHSSGCRRWLQIVRDTATHEILAVHRTDEAQPVIA